MRSLADGRYREADRIVPVMDHLNIHSPASIYEAFAPEEAKRIADRETTIGELEVVLRGDRVGHPLADHAALGRDLLDRVGDKVALEYHVEAWQRRRNDAGTKADWQFTTADARIKLRRLYPTRDDKALGRAPLAAATPRTRRRGPKTPHRCSAPPDRPPSPGRPPARPRRSAP